MGHPRRHDNQVADFGIHGFATGGMKSDFAGGDVKGFVVHFVEVEDGTVGFGEDEGLDDGEAVLGEGAVFEDAVFVGAHGAPGGGGGAEVAEGEGFHVREGGAIEGGGGGGGLRVGDS